MKTNKGWRPSKALTFIEAFKQVLKKDEFDVVIMTDDELREECNALLEPWNQISDSTFEKWKAWKVKDNAVLSEFLRLYKKALSNQRRLLFVELKKDTKAWQRFAWIIERKFGDWNLRRIGEMSHTIKDYSFTSNLDDEPTDQA